MALAQAKVSESMTLMVSRQRSGNRGSRGESLGYVVRSIRELDSEAPGVFVVMNSDRFVVSSQILRRVARSGSIFVLCDCDDALGNSEARLKVIATLSVCYVVSGVIGILYLEFFDFEDQVVMTRRQHVLSWCLGGQIEYVPCLDIEICLLTDFWFRTLAH